MANSKHAHFRYNIMDYCFRNKSFSFDGLLNYLNERIEEVYPGESIAVRTLREDLKLFRDPENGFGAPLPNKARILKYNNPEFSIAKTPLLPYETYLIEAAQQLLERFDNHPKYSRLAEALVKFQDGEDDEYKEQVLFYDVNEEYKGIKWLKPLFLAIHNKQVLKITYKGFKEENSKEFRFHPYVLKQYNNRWFVFGLNKEMNNPAWSIPLDERLLSMEVVEDQTYIPSTTNWDSYFRTMVGVTRTSDNVERVVLKFYNGREAYFKTKPFIPDYEEFFEEEKSGQVWFDTIINKELIQQILSFGSDVEVLEPEELRKILANHISVLEKLYSIK